MKSFVRFTVLQRVALVMAIGLILLGGYLLFNLQRDTRPVDLPAPPLKELAIKHNLTLGNFGIATRIDERQYHQILTSQFDLMLIDNTPNWYFTDGGLRPSESEFDFKQMDRLVQYAQSNSMKIEAHHYLWGEEKWLPAWLKKGDYSRQQLDTIIDNHIRTVGEHYRGKINNWTVVNEAFSRGQNIYGLRDWWADAYGSKDYIERAFIEARSADPSSKLILNDFGNESINAISNEMFDYISEAKQKGVPIDGLGMQMHIDGSHPPTKDEVKANMKRFVDIGLLVYVTEFDVNMNDVPAGREDREQIQAKIYYEMLRACIETDGCVSFAYLGITDKETWYNYMGLHESRPLPFDEDYQPKPAFWSMRTALTEE